MRKLILLAAGLGAVSLFPAAAQADHRDEQRELRQLQRECQRDLSRARTRRQFLIIQRQCRIEIAQARRELFFAERRHFRHDRFDDDFDRRRRGHGDHRGRGRDRDDDDDD